MTDGNNAGKLVFTQPLQFFDKLIMKVTDMCGGPAEAHETENKKLFENIKHSNNGSTLVKYRGYNN